MEIDAIVARARELGKAVAAHERCAKLKEAVAALGKDEAARKLQEDYARAAGVLQDKEARGAVLEPEEKRAEADLRSKVAANKTLMSLLRAQADYHELIGKVQSALEEAIGLE